MRTLVKMNPVYDASSDAILTRKEVIHTGNDVIMTGRECHVILTGNEGLEHVVLFKENGTMVQVNGHTILPAIGIHF
jgi:hypothetical protein